MAGSLQGILHRWSFAGACGKKASCAETGILDPLVFDVRACWVWRQPVSVIQRGALALVWDLAQWITAGHCGKPKSECNERARFVCRRVLKIVCVWRCSVLWWRRPVALTGRILFRIQRPGGFVRKTKSHTTWWTTCHWRFISMMQNRWKRGESVLTSLREGISVTVRRWWAISKDAIKAQAFQKGYNDTALSVANGRTLKKEDTSWFSRRRRYLPRRRKGLRILKTDSRSGRTSLTIWQFKTHPCGRHASMVALPFWRHLLPWQAKPLKSKLKCWALVKPETLLAYICQPRPIEARKACGLWPSQAWTLNRLKRY